MTTNWLPGPVHITLQRKSFFLPLFITLPWKGLTFFFGHSSLVLIRCLLLRPPVPPYCACLFLHYPTLRHSSNQTAEQPIGKENAILKGLMSSLSRLKMRVADRVIIFRHMAVSTCRC